MERILTRMVSITISSLRGWKMLERFAHKTETLPHGRLQTVNRTLHRQILLKNGRSWQESASLTHPKTLLESKIDGP
jgi:hypothetical protein